MNPGPFVNATIGFAEKLFLVFICDDNCNNLICSYRNIVKVLPIPAFQQIPVMMLPIT